MRISGLASGMDIDSIVSDMMKIKRMPLDKLKQQKQTMEWQRDDYREMNTLLLNFRSELTQMKLTTKYRTRTTTTTDDSKVTATASSAAALSSYSIQSVSKLATAATKVNAGAISSGEKDSDGNIIKIDPAASLYTERDKFLNSKTVNEIGTEPETIDNFNWKAGSVESKSLSAKKDSNTVSLKLEDGIEIQELSSMNVTVNGKLYKAVSEVQSDKLAENEVLVDLQSGTLTFNEMFKNDSTVKVDYVANKRIDTFTLSEKTTEFSLTKGSLSSVVVHPDTKVIEGLKITVTNNGEAIEYSVAKTSESEWSILDVDNISVIGTIEPNTGKIKGFTKGEAGSQVDVEYQQNYLDFNIKTYTSKGEVSENFLVQGTESLNSVINKVNASNVGVNMFYDSFSDQVTLTRTETGNFNNDKTKNEGYEIITSGGFIDNVLGFKDGEEKNGTNAVFTINGLKTERNSNTFAVNGVTFTLKQTFNDSDDSDDETKNNAPPVTIAINNNNDEIFNNIKSFIDKYNELIGKIQEKTQQERYKSYSPLTDEQREQLSDKQQEQWEEKAKSGLLRRDQTLTSLLSSMRMDFYGKVESERINPIYNQLANIGIKTTANYLEGGKLEINEAELKKAIEEDPESIEALFNASGTTNSQKGIAQRLYDTVGRTMDILYEKAGKSYSTNNQFTIGKQLNNIDDQIDSLEDRLKALEDRYYRQFTAMEKAIQNANQQSAYIMQNFYS